MPNIATTEERTVRVQAAGVELDGTLAIPTNAQGIVLFAHGSGSSRFSTRNRYVASFLREGRLATFLIDLLTPDEEAVDNVTAEFRFDIGRLADRLVGTSEWLGAERDTADLPIGLFGASTGGGAALVAAAALPDRIHAVVSRGGRPDLAGDALEAVRAPTLLIVGGNDPVVIELNRSAMQRLRAPNQLEIVPGATHLFEEPGTLDEVARLARDWFTRFLR